MLSSQAWRSTVWSDVRDRNWFREEGRQCHSVSEELAPAFAEASVDLDDGLCDA